MSGILTQDSISLTVSLDGVCFCYLATSSGKAGTIGQSTKQPARSHKSDPLLYPPQLWGKQIPTRWPCGSSSARCSHVLQLDGQCQCYVTVTGHFLWVWGLKLKPHAFPCERVLCQVCVSCWNRCSCWLRVQNTSMRHWFAADSPGKKTLGVNWINKSFYKNTPASLIIEPNGR